jgi:hypothetical protein
MSLLVLDFVAEALVELVGEAAWNRLVSALVAAVIFAVLCVASLAFWATSGDSLYLVVASVAGGAGVIAALAHLRSG